MYWRFRRTRINTNAGRRKRQKDHFSPSQATDVKAVEDSTSGWQMV